MMPGLRGVSPVAWIFAYTRGTIRSLSRSHPPHARNVERPDPPAPALRSAWPAALARETRDVEAAASGGIAVLLHRAPAADPTPGKARRSSLSLSLYTPACRRSKSNARARWRLRSTIELRERNAYIFPYSLSLSPSLSLALTLIPYLAVREPLSQKSVAREAAHDRSARFPFFYGQTGKIKRTHETVEQKYAKENAVARRFSCLLFCHGRVFGLTDSLR